MRDDLMSPPDELAAIDLGAEAHIALARQQAARRQGEALRPIRMTDWRSSAPATPQPPAPAVAGSSCICGGVGWYKEAVPLGHPNFAKLLPCSCKRAEQAQRRQDAQRELLAALGGEMGELAAKTFATFDPDWDAASADLLRSARATCQRWADAPGDRWLFLTGPCGTGKSHLAAAAALELARSGRSAFYRSAPAMLEALRAGYRAGDFDARLAAVCDVPVLVLDDLGAESPTASNRSLLFTILNHRALRPDLITIITSNVDLEPFAESDPEFPNLDKRIASRIAMRATVVPVIAHDYRVQLGTRRAS